MIARTLPNAIAHPSWRGLHLSRWQRGTTLRVITLAAYTLVTVFPFYWMIITTFKQNSDLYSETNNPLWFNAPPTFDNVTYLLEHRRLVQLAAQNRLPTMYPLKEFVDAGGLMSYGADDADLFRRAAAYVDKILKGAKPENLPVQQATKFQLVINVKTAKALSLTIPAAVLGRADQVIEN